MIYLLYDLILYLSALLLVPYYLLRGLRYGKTRRGIRERLGAYPPDFVTALRGRRVIWVHAVSVGETRAAAPLFKALSQAYPDAFLLLSHVTETGREVAMQVDEADGCIFFPFDLSWVTRRVMRRIRPAVIILMETEIWPNFVNAAHRQGVPVVLVNGRISDRSQPRYRLAGRLLKPVLAGISSFCMQTARDGRRIRRLGADPARIAVTGNLKFDMPAPVWPELPRKELLARYALPATCRIWVAGSTHPGEEKLLGEVYRRLLARHPDLLLVLVPRRPERACQVGEELAGQGLRFLLRTAVDTETAPLSPGEVLLVDTVGELMSFYALAELIFVGGSLVPVGGHNILEAALLGKPVLFGPNMQNFQEIAAKIRRAEGGLAVADGEELYHRVAHLLDTPDEARRIGANGYRLLLENRGATVRTMDEIARYLGVGRHG